MRATPLLLCVGFVVAFSMPARAADRGCATVDFGPRELPRAPVKGQAPGLDATPTITIPVAFHVISQEVVKSGKVTKVGDVSTSKLDAQIAVLNSAFASTGFKFVKQSVDRTTNNTWFTMTMGSAVEAAAKRSLAKSPATTLNIYTCGIPNGHLGWSYFPWSFVESNTMHGLVLLYTTLPGGSASRYDKGDTAVHEIGHWLGLYHTFEGGCSGNGDYVTDTPAEATPSYSCTSGRDTCPASGVDPVKNFMDYGDDACMNAFTAGQRARMQWALATYKRSLIPPMTAQDAGSTGRSGAGAARFLAASPNPFNPTTTVSFELTASAQVSLRVFDVQGRAIATLVDEVRNPGVHHAPFAAPDLASGVYFAVLQTGEARLQQRLVLLK